VSIGRDGDAVGEDGDWLVPVDIEERFGGGEFEDRAVLPEAIEAAGAEFGEAFAGRLARFVSHGIEHEIGRAFVLGEHGLRDQVDGVFDDAAPADGAEGAAGARPEEAHEVVNFGGGGDGGAGVAGGVFLADGDAGGDAIDLIDLGLFHAFEELAGVGGEGFDVAALAFSVDGVERERGFAGAGNAGDDGEFVVGDGEGEVFEVAEARASDDDFAGTGLLAQFGWEVSV